MGMKKRALRTLPGCVGLNRLAEPHDDDALVAVAVQDIPDNVRFGPYEGRSNTDFEAHDFKKHVDLQFLTFTEDGEPQHYVDGADREHSNWLRYIRFPEAREEANMRVIHFKGEVFFITTKCVKEGEELLACVNEIYGNEVVPPEPYPSGK